MKKRIWVLLLCWILAGCGGEETFETVSDEMILPVMAQPREVQVSLPGELALPVMESNNGRLYLTQDYEITLHTAQGNTLEETMKALSGHSRDEMTVMETFLDGISRYEFVWTAAGENCERIGRGVILDDGKYHYCMTALWDADTTETSQICWDQVFGSFSVEAY